MSPRYSRNAMIRGLTSLGNPDRKQQQTLVLLSCARASAACERCNVAVYILNEEGRGRISYLDDGCIAFCDPRAASRSLCWCGRGLRQKTLERRRVEQFVRTRVVGQEVFRRNR